MNPSLQYSELSPETVKRFHNMTGGLIVELSPPQGELLLSLLDQRDRIESDLMKDSSAFRLLWDICLWKLYEFQAWFFHRRLLALLRYVRAVDAAHGWETAKNGSKLFLLMPILNTEAPGQTLQRDAPSSGAPLS